MDRHDAIVRYIARAVATERSSEVKLDARVTEVELEQCRNMKPDIQIWNRDRNQVKILEVNSPYGKRWEGRDSLQEKYEAKRSKYLPLIKELNDRGIEAQLYVIVVSSLGAVYKETEKAIYSLIKNKRAAEKTVRVISTIAITESAKLWWKVRRRADEDGEVNEEGMEKRNEAEEDGETREAGEEVDIEDVEEWMRENENEDDEGVKPGEEELEEEEHDEEEETTDVNEIEEWQEEEEINEESNEMLANLGLREPNNNQNA